MDGMSSDLGRELGFWNSAHKLDVIASIIGHNPAWDDVAARVAEHEPGLDSHAAQLRVKCILISEDERGGEALAEWFLAALKAAR
jgi:hypothetical protein